MNQTFDTPRQDDQFREFLGVLRRRKAAVALGVATCLLLGVASILLATPSYKVVARVLLKSYSDGTYRPATNAVDRVNQVGVPPEIGAQISLMGSPQVVEPAIRQANITISPDFAAGEALSIKQENTTPVLDVEVNLADPESASRLAQAIPAAYNDYVQSNDAAKATATTNAVRTRVNAARAAATKAQNDLEVYLAQQGVGGKNVVAVSGAEGTQRTERLTAFEQQLESARVGLDSAQSALQTSLAAQAKVPQTIEDTNERPSVEQLQSQKKLIADLRAELKAAQVVSTDLSPDVRALKARLAQQEAYLRTIPTKTVLTGEMRNPERAVYDQRVAEAQTRFASSQAEVAKLEGIVASERAGLEAYQKRLPRQRELEASVEEKRRDVLVASQTLGEVEGVGSATQPAIQVVSITAPVKTKPAIGRTLVASTILGFVLGVIAALLRDRFDNRIYTLEQIYDASGATPIGQVSVSRKLSLESGGSRNRVLESYRSLRYNLESSGTSGVVQSVLVTSASAGEGRAGLSVNLATEAATDMRKTILVDGDLRTPELHERYKLARSPGLSDVLAGTVSLQDALKETGQANLLFLSAGTEHHNPLELLSGPSMAATHEALKEMADVIVFNSPSLMRYTDARALAKVTDSAIFVAKQGFTRRDAMRYCVGMLRRAKASFLGVVLVDERMGRASDVPYFAAE